MRVAIATSFIIVCQLEYIANNIIHVDVYTYILCTAIYICSHPSSKFC